VQPAPIELPDRFFARQDESADEQFYRVARFTTHIDDATIANLTQYYRETLSASSRLLDLMSSWISHLPEDVKFARVTGLGMNEEELAGNNRLDEFCVQNLNQEPTLKYDVGSFDGVLIAVSVQYLIRPFDVFAEIGRVLAPGGKCIVAMSHRLFPTKAIYAFQVLPPDERCRLVSAYMSQTNCFEEIELTDRSPPGADPLWLVTGIRV